MARPWRIEFEGALYHVPSRGNEHKDIFRDYKDRVSFLNCLGEMSARFETDIFAYVLLSNPKTLLEKAARILDCNLIDYRRSLRISEQYRDKRDLLIYLLWEIGLYKNQEIGDLLGLTYSSISRRANITRARISKDIKFKKQFKQLKSQIKM